MTDPKHMSPRREKEPRAPIPGVRTDGGSGKTTSWPAPTESSSDAVAGLSRDHLLDERYRIRRLLGSGGMADVYEAFDLELDETIAVKVVHPDIASRESMVSQFKKEIKLARKIVHPNVCRIYDFGSAGELIFVTMELVPGSTLDSLTKERSDLELDAKIEMFREILSGLEAAHETGIIHRDLKPQNVMVTPEGRAVIMDFGIARELSTDEISTTTSEVIGTPAYMAPERMLGNAVDQRADIYSLGVILFELATQRRPFSGMTVFDMAQNQLSVDPPSPSAINPELPAWLEPIILKMLAKRPVDRFQTVSQLMASLPQSGRIKTVLLVDDDTVMLNLVGIHLNQAGISVVTAKDGAEGVSMVLEKKPDLLCVDFTMPQMDGFQVADYLRRLGEKVPIFMLTGMQDPQYEKQAVRLGIEQFFTKPLDIEAFVQAVSRRLASL